MLLSTHVYGQATFTMLSSTVCPVLTVESWRSASCSSMKNAVAKMHTSVKQVGGASEDCKSDVLQTAPGL